MGGSDRRGQISGAGQATLVSIKLFCCTGWATAVISEEDEFQLFGFDIEYFDIDQIKTFCKNERPLYLVGGAHYIAIASKFKFLMIQNRSSKLIEFKTTVPIISLFSSYFDCFISLENTELTFSATL